MIALLAVYIVSQLLSVFLCLFILSSTFSYISQHTLKESPNTLLLGFIRLRYVSFLYISFSFIFATLSILIAIIYF